MRFLKKSRVISVLLILVLAMACITPALAAETEPAWSTMASMPTARGNFLTAVVNGKIYLIGGNNSAGFVNLVEEYNPTVNTWTTKSPMPVACSGAESAVIDGKIYVFGGTNGVTYCGFYIYDPAVDTWTTKNNFTGRVHHQVAVVNGKIYVIGGERASDSAYTNSVEAYDPATDTWTTKAPMQTARGIFKTAVVNGKIYVIGGLINGRNYLNSVERYDPTTDTWTSMASMSIARSELGIAVINNKIYALGGYQYNGSTTIATDSVELYDPETNTWSTKASMATARRSHQIAVVNNNIFAIGGFNSYALASVEQYNPETNIWTSKASMVSNRGTFSAIVIDGSIYSFGGYSQTNSPYLNSVEKYTPNASGNAKLMIYMIDGALKEYDVTMDKVNDFISWYDGRATGTGKFYYIFDKTYSDGTTGKEYLIFDKIKDFVVK